MLAQIGHRVVVRRREVADVEVDLEVRRQLSAPRRSFRAWRTRSGSLVFEWLCIATSILCFAANGTMRLRHRQRGGRRDEAGAERLRHLEAAIDLLVREVRTGL
jgi:hypothetical protein